MQLLASNRAAPGGYIAGPWLGNLGVAVAFHAEDDLPHYHRQMREIGIVVSGRAELLVMEQVYEVEAGGAAIVDPGEVHAWRGMTPDFRLVVVHEPYVAGDRHAVALV